MLMKKLSFRILEKRTYPPNRCESCCISLCQCQRFSQTTVYCSLPAMGLKLALRFSI